MLTRLVVQCRMERCEFVVSQISAWIRKVLALPRRALADFARVLASSYLNYWKSALLRRSRLAARQRQLKESLIPIATSVLKTRYRNQVPNSSIATRIFRANSIRPTVIKPQTNSNERRSKSMIQAAQLKLPVGYPCIASDGFQIHCAMTWLTPAALLLSTMAMPMVTMEGTSQVS